MVTLKGIAKELGVSHTLVSRVISGRMGTTRVSESTRQAILKRAKELDFQPNRLATALQEGRKGVVGLFLHRIGTPGSELSHRFASTASNLLDGYGDRLLLRYFRNKADFETFCSPGIKNQVDGLIVGGVPHPEMATILEEYDKSGLPVIGAFHHVDVLANLPNFQVDHSMQSYLATKHLLEQGCRRLAHFYVMKERQDGYLRAHAEAGVSPDPRLTLNARMYHYDDGRECMQYLIESGISYDGIVADSDAQAAGALNLWIQRHQRLEGWPRITGIDDSPIATSSIVPLTSVTSEVEETATAAVNALYEKRSGKNPVSARLTPRLVIRESSTRSTLA